MKRLATVLSLFLALPLPLVGQSATDWLANGIEAYRQLDYGVAADLFRRALETTGTDALAPGQRAGVWVYLGAAQSFLGRDGAARQSFAEALLADPRHRPDPLIFPPEVTALFDEVRARSSFVRVVAPPDTVIRPGDGRYRIRLVASSPHDVTADLRTEDGGLVRRLYDGPVSDSLEVRWDGLDASGRTPSVGRLVLNVSSDGHAVHVPLTATVIVQDSLDHPPRPATSLPAQSAQKLWPAIGSLAGGLVAGTIAIALPELVARDERGGAGRYIIGGTLSLAGLLSFLAQREPAVNSAEITAERNAIDAWRRQVDQVVSENQRRRNNARLRITAGAPVTQREDE